MNFYLQRLQNDIASAIEGLTEQELCWHPEGKWSTAEILEHLFLTYTGTIKGFERCLAAKAPLARKPTLKDHVQTFVVIRCGHLPEGRKAPKHAVPRGLSSDQVREQILSKISEMDAVIAQAIHSYGPSRRLLDHPILGPLRGPEWCKFHWVHGCHHLKQIRRLRRSSAPSAA